MNEDKLEKERTQLIIEHNKQEYQKNYEILDDLQYKIFKIEKISFLKALDNFQKSTIELSNAWGSCNVLLEELTISDTYPFDTDFENIEYKISIWASELLNNIQNYRKEL